MFDKNVEECLLNAAHDAQERSHEFLCLEHLLAAILDNNEGQDILNECGADVGLIKEQLEDFFETKMEST